MYPLELEAQIKALSKDFSDLSKRIDSMEKQKEERRIETQERLIEEVQRRFFGYVRDPLSGEKVEFETTEPIEKIREALFSYRRSGPQGEISPPSWTKQSKIEQKIREEFGFEREKLGFERDAGAEILEPEMQIEIEEEYREGLSPETNRNINHLKREAIERKLQEQQASLETAIRERLFGPKTAQEPLQFTYQGEIQSFFERDGRKFAKVFLIDSTMNKAGWGVTPEATRKALASLRDLPLLGPPEKAHRLGAYKVGVFRSYENNGTAYGLFEIMDNKAWEKIKSREWRYVSPMIFASKVEKTPNGDLITDYIFDHIAFCNFPAYPEVGNGVVATYGS